MIFWKIFMIFAVFPRLTAEILPGLPRCRVSGRCGYRPLQGQCTNTMSLRGPPGRGNLPVRSCGYMGTDIEATLYREIPTDGIAVLGMTYFLHAASIFTFSARKIKGGSRPSPTLIILRRYRCPGPGHGSSLPASPRNPTPAAPATYRKGYTYTAPGASFSPVCTAHPPVPARIRPG